MNNHSVAQPLTGRDRPSSMPARREVCDSRAEVVAGLVDTLAADDRLDLTRPRTRARKLDHRRLLAREISHACSPAAALRASRRHCGKPIVPTG